MILMCAEITEEANIIFQFGRIKILEIATYTIGIYQLKVDVEISESEYLVIEPKSELLLLRYRYEYNAKEKTFYIYFALDPDGTPIRTFFNVTLKNDAEEKIVDCPQEIISENEASGHVIADAVLEGLDQFWSNDIITENSLRPNDIFVGFDKDGNGLYVPRGEKDRVYGAITTEALFFASRYLELKIEAINNTGEKRKFTHRISENWQRRAEKEFSEGKNITARQLSRFNNTYRASVELKITADKSGSFVVYLPFPIQIVALFFESDINFRFVNYETFVNNVMDSRIAARRALIENLEYSHANKSFVRSIGRQRNLRNNPQTLQYRGAQLILDDYLREALNGYSIGDDNEDFGGPDDNLLMFDDLEDLATWRADEDLSILMKKAALIVQNLEGLEYYQSDMPCMCLQRISLPAFTKLSININHDEKLPAAIKCRVVFTATFRNPDEPAFRPQSILSSDFRISSIPIGSQPVFTAAQATFYPISREDVASQASVNYSHTLEFDATNCRLIFQNSEEFVITRVSVANQIIIPGPIPINYFSAENHVNLFQNIGRIVRAGSIIIITFMNISAGTARLNGVISYLRTP